MGMPVKVFKSSDVTAPQLSGVRGDFKTVIKACLVTGYGSGENLKTSLGWGIVPGTESADGYTCAFRPQSSNSSENIVKIDCTSGSTALLTGWFDANANGTLSNGSSNMIPLPYWAAGGVDWWLIGHENSFIFVVRWKGKNNNDQAGGVSRGMFFGEIGTNINNSRANTLLLRLAGSYDVLNNYNTDDLASHLAPENTRISMSADGLKFWEKTTQGFQTGEMSHGYSKIKGDMYFSKVSLVEGGEFRGFWPFGYLVHHKLKSPENFTIKNIGGVDYLLALCGQGLRENPSYGVSMPILINLVEWDF